MVTGRQDDLLCLEPWRLLQRLGNPVGILSPARRKVNLFGHGFESPGRMVFPNVQEMDISIAGDRLVVPIMEVSGSIWILENVDR